LCVKITLEFVLEAIFIIVILRNPLFYIFNNLVTDAATNHSSIFSSVD